MIDTRNISEPQDPLDVTLTAQLFCGAVPICYGNPPCHLTRLCFDNISYERGSYTGPCVPMVAVFLVHGLRPAPTPESRRGI